MDSRFYIRFSSPFVTGGFISRLFYLSNMDKRYDLDMAEAGCLDAPPFIPAGSIRGGCYVITERGYCENGTH